MFVQKHSPIDELVSMGFTKSQAEKALKLCKNDLNQATDWLLNNCDLGGMDVEDQDYQFALRLQQEESANQPSGVLCGMLLLRSPYDGSEIIQLGLSGQRFPGEQIYILDDCSHKFSKTHLVEYINTSVMTQVNVKCPSCTAAISGNSFSEFMMY